MLGHLCAAAALLHLAGQAGAQIISVTVPDVSYDSKMVESQAYIGEKYYLSYKLNSIALSCMANSTTNMNSVSIVWRRRDGTALDSKVSISNTDLTNPLSAKSTLTVGHPVKSDFTTYVCTANGTNGTGSFLTKPLLTITVNGVNEYDSSHWPGETVSLKCTVSGYPSGNRLWTKSTNTSFSSTDETITLPSISYATDRGYYICTSTNTLGTNYARVFLRVKDSQSYIAPLVSIFCEIILIVIIVTGYELYAKSRRRVADGDLKSE